MRRSLHTSLLSVLLLGVSTQVFAAPTLRYSINQKGDFVLIGNTLGVDCANGVASRWLVGGTEATAACALEPAGDTKVDSAPDLFVRSDAPANGGLLVSSATPALNARSTAVLATGPGGGTRLPSGATITYARVYWAGTLPTGGVPGKSATFEKVGPNGFSSSLTSDATTTSAATTESIWYQNSADVTQLVAQAGAGAYRMSGVESQPIANFKSNVTVTFWHMVVIYRSDTEVVRNLSIFDGLQTVAQDSKSAVVLSGFSVPTGGFDAKLGVVAYDGDGIEGDQVRFGPTGRVLTAADALSDAQNPVNDFFNGTRSALGQAVTFAGDLPQPNGAAGSMSGFDMDIVDIKSKLKGGQTSAQVEASTAGDVFGFGAFITSISTFNPDFAGTTKKVKNLAARPDDLVLPGDTLEYTIETTNNGSDKAARSELVDVLSTDLEFVPNSIQVVSGPNSGQKTDATGDDQGEYQSNGRKVVVRLGTGANATQGGILNIGETTSVRFQAKVLAMAGKRVSNLATVTAVGDTALKQGVNTPQSWGSSESGKTPGTPTELPVGGCMGDECDSDKDGLTDAIEKMLGTDPQNPDSDGDTHPDGVEAPNGRAVDTDQDGKIDALDLDSDNDCVPDQSESNEARTNPALPKMNADANCKDGQKCNTMTGECVSAACKTDADCGAMDSGRVCDANKKCINGCRGKGGNGCPSAERCTSKTTAIGKCAVECSKDADCPSGEVCDTVNGYCVPDGVVEGGACATSSHASSSHWLLGLGVAFLGARAARSRKGARQHPRQD